LTGTLHEYQRNFLMLLMLSINSWCFGRSFR